MTYALTYMTNDLESAYVLWSNEPFPLGSTRDDIDELHAELATVDEWVMSMVIPYVEHGTPFPMRVDIAGGIGRLRDRVLELREAAHDEDRALLDRYRVYVGLLDGVFRAYTADAPSWATTPRRGRRPWLKGD